jgi:hypothetical protein
MFKVIKETSPAEEKKHVSAIPDYSFFTGRLSGCGKGMLFLKCFGSLVCLEGEKGTWTYPNMEFTDYRPVDVEIHVKEQE